MKKSAVIIGAGPGLGMAVARKFASEGFGIILVARNEQSLKDMAEELRHNGTNASYKIADAADNASLTKAIEEIKAENVTPDCVVYNVGITAPDAEELTAEDLMNHFKTDVAGALKKDIIALNNGVEMPRIGFGVYQIPASQTERYVMDALSVGYRSIDTAQCYYNETEVGNAIRKSGIPRDGVFVTTKLWGGRGYSFTVLSIDSSLNRLGMDYIDLLLIHEPTGDYKEFYRAMEEAFKAGKLRAEGRN